MHLCVCRYRSLTWHLIYSSTLLTHGIGVTQVLFSSACLGRQPSRGNPGSYSLVLRLQMAAILTQLYYMVSGDLSSSPHVCSNNPVLPEKFSQLFCMFKSSVQISYPTLQVIACLHYFTSVFESSLLSYSTVLSFLQKVLPTDNFPFSTKSSIKMFSLYVL